MLLPGGKSEYMKFFILISGGNCEVRIWKSEHIRTRSSLLPTLTKSTDIVCDLIAGIKEGSHIWNRQPIELLVWQLKNCTTMSESPSFKCLTVTAKPVVSLWQNLCGTVYLRRQHYTASLLDTSTLLKVSPPTQVWSCFMNVPLHCSTTFWWYCSDWWPCSEVYSISWKVI